MVWSSGSPAGIAGPGFGSLARYCFSLCHHPLSSLGVLTDYIYVFSGSSFRLNSMCLALAVPDEFEVIRDNRLPAAILGEMR